MKKCVAYLDDRKNWIRSRFIKTEREINKRIQSVKWLGFTPKVFTKDGFEKETERPINQPRRALVTHVNISLLEKTHEMKRWSEQQRRSNKGVTFY